MRAVGDAGDVVGRRPAREFRTQQDCIAFCAFDQMHDAKRNRERRGEERQRKQEVERTRPRVQKYRAGGGDGAHDEKGAGRAAARGGEDAEEGREERMDQRKARGVGCVVGDHDRDGADTEHKGAGERRHHEGHVRTARTKQSEGDAGDHDKRQRNDMDRAVHRRKERRHSGRERKTAAEKKAAPQARVAQGPLFLLQARLRLFCCHAKPPELVRFPDGNTPRRTGGIGAVQQDSQGATTTGCGYYMLRYQRRCTLHTVGEERGNAPIVSLTAHSAVRFARDPRNFFVNF